MDRAGSIVKPMLGSVPRRDAVLFLVVLVAAAAARLYGLGSPDELVFDEVYYAQDACFYLGWGEGVCGVATEASHVHPPLGKWLIAFGILLFGHEPTGWRVMPALAGIAIVGFVYVLTRRLTASSLAATVAAGFLALDPLSIVSSRVAMLDIFSAGAGVAAVTFAVLDRDRVASRGPDARRMRRPWLIAAGLAGGVAIGTKWSGALVLGAVVLLVLAWEVAALRRGGRTTASALVGAAPAVFVWLLALPALVYAASFAGRLDGDLLSAPWQQDAWVRQLGGRQLQMLGFHAGLDETHRAASPAWSWLLGKRAVVYFFEVDAAGRYREVLAFANPLLWLPGAAAAGWAALVAARRRALWSAEVLVAAAVASAYLPWLVLTAGRPFVFLHYIVPTIPFLALALGWALSRMPRLPGRAFAAAVGATAIGVVVFWSPLIYAWPLDYDAWRSRIVFADCGPEAVADGRLMPRPTVATDPPPGWCWV